ncbi:MAG: DUF1501 domain-containing protein [Verrucomicrobia bacterium]|nr:DUF1501 domain-containing protein [Verrucomicrobiota bacterium]
MRRREFLTTMGALPFLPRLISGSQFLNQSNRSLILIWMDGGMSHIDTFDGKVEAPPDIRGDLVSKESSLEGVFVSEHLPQLSALMNRCALIRSITSPEGNHDRGSCYMLTGRRPNPVLRYPSFGSVFGREAVRDDNLIPPYVAIPDAHEYARQGFLPITRGPFEVGGSPGLKDFKVKDLEPPPQLQKAMNLLKTVDQLDGYPRSESELGRDQFLNQARFLSLNPKIRAMFDVNEESEKTRSRYGRHFLGQSCLLARRLIEGGVRTVFVRFTGWDHHQGIASALTFGYPPKLTALDQSVSALHEDLERRGLLKNTLVMLASEFGRTPRLNPGAGRDHWSRASSSLLFGAGLKPGVVVGKTDARGEAPIERPVSPADVFYTVLSALGADVEQKLYTPTGRPIPIVEEQTQLIKEILA